MKRLIIALICLPAPSSAEPLLSGLPDPLSTRSTCFAFAKAVEQDARDPVLDLIAMNEAMVAHKIFTRDAKLASQVLSARADGTLDMHETMVRLLVENVCRDL